MSKTAQSFANHAKFVPLYHFVLFPILLLYVLWSLWQVIQNPGLETVVAFVMSLVIVLITLFARVFALQAQDRVIRLEETLRLRQLLSPEQFARLGELRRQHYIAIRFAADDEVPALIQRVFAGELKTGKEIKQAIRTWRPDYHRL